MFKPIYLLTLGFIAIFNIRITQSVNIFTIIKSFDIHPKCLVILILPPEIPEFEDSSVPSDLELQGLSQNSHPLVVTSITKGLDGIQAKEGCRLILDFVDASSPNKSSNLKPKAVSFDIIVTTNISNDESITSRNRIFILTGDHSLSWCLFCGICSNSKDKYQSVPSPSDVNRLCTIQSTGHDQVAYFDSDASLKLYMVLTPRDLCELHGLMLTKSEFRCTSTNTIVNILSSRLNVTFSKESQITDFASEDELYDIDPNPALVVCIEKCPLDLETNLEGRTASVLMNHEKHYIMYCKPMHEYEDPSWLIIFEPFDPYIWTCLLGTAILLAVLHRNVRYAFDIFFILLGQHCQVKWSRWSGLLCLLLLILNQEYQGEETTKVTAPLGTQQIRSLREVFENQYKFVLPDTNTAALVSAVMKTRLAQLGQNHSDGNIVVNDTFVNLNDGIRWGWFVYMAQFKWVLPVGNSNYQELLQTGMFRQNRIHNVSCYFVVDMEADDDQYLFNRNSYYMAWGRLKDKAYWTLEHMQAAGLYVYWKGNSIRQDIFLSGLKHSCSTVGGCEDEGSYKALSIHSPVLIVIYWHLFICALALSLLFAEHLRNIKKYKKAMLSKYYVRIKVRSFVLP